MTQGSPGATAPRQPDRNPTRPRFAGAAPAAIAGASPFRSAFRTALGPTTLVAGLLACWTAPAAAAVCEPESLGALRFGEAMAQADFDGDGRVDVLISAPGSAPAGDGPVLLLRSLPGGLQPGRRFGPSGFGGPGADATGRLFGRALATGDFNGDGLLDLAIGAPAQSASGDGGVYLFRGTALGLAAERVLRSTGASATGRGSFGSALAAGDFDGDGRTDLAVAAPLAADAGQVQLFAGLPDILSPRETLLGASGVLDSELGRLDSLGEPGDCFGHALLAADFDRDGLSDLAVAAPGDRAETGAPDSGRVFLYRGTLRSLLSADRVLDQTQSERDLEPREARVFRGEAGDRFGSALAAGDFDADGWLDLAIGAPGERAREAEDPDEADGPGAGFVFLFQGGPAGLTPAAGIDQELVELPRDDDDFFENEDGDGFGSALASGDFDGDGLTDLAVGSPGEAIRSNGRSERAEPRSGWVLVFHGQPSGLRPGTAHSPELASLGENREGDAFGSFLGAGLDLDSDGREDLLIGAPGAPGMDGSMRGVLFLFRGTATDGLAGVSPLEPASLSTQPLDLNHP